MARNLTSEVAAAIVQQVVRLAFFAEFQFASGTLRVWSGQGNKSWNSQTWTGTGDYGGVSPVQETGQVTAAGLTFTLSGVPSGSINLALNDAYRGRLCKLWLAILDTTDAVVGTFQVFGGRMDILSIEDGGETARLSIQAENRLIDLRRARSSRYTDAEQQRRWPGDLGLEFVARLAERPIYWGVPAAAAAALPAYSGAAANDGYVTGEAW